MSQTKLKDTEYLANTLQSIAPGRMIPNIDVVNLKAESQKKGSSRQRKTNYDHKSKTIFFQRESPSTAKGRSSTSRVMKALAIMNGLLMPGSKKPNKKVSSPNNPKNNKSLWKLSPAEQKKFDDWLKDSIAWDDEYKRIHKAEIEENNRNFEALTREQEELKRK